MNGRRVAREQSAGWGTVVAVALLGLALAALVLLTPWQFGGAPGARDGLSSTKETRSEFRINPPVGGLASARG
jgi:hypothetical protein